MRAADIAADAVLRVDVLLRVHPAVAVSGKYRRVLADPLEAAGRWYPFPHAFFEMPHGLDGRRARITGCTWYWLGGFAVSDAESRHRAWRHRQEPIDRHIKAARARQRRGEGRRRNQWRFMQAGAR